MFRRVWISVAISALWLTSVAHAQDSNPTEIDPKTLNTLTSKWTQPQKEWGFLHYDQVFPNRKIARGPAVRPLLDGNALSTFSDGGVGAERLQDLIDNHKLAGIVVLHDGKLRLERYALGHSVTGRWPSFSVAKSITSTLLGAAIKDGSIGSVNDPVTRYLPELVGSGYDGVSVHHVLTMSSGVRWNEDYTDAKSDVAQLVFGPVDEGYDATLSYMRKVQRASPPGQKWNYNTGETDLIGELVARATGKTLAEYASEKIWAAYGMEQDASWRLNRSTREHGGCCIHASLRDYARFGQYVLDDARVNGESIVPEGWFQAATRKQVEIGQAGRGYGYQWWTIDDGTFNAYGIYGQMIHIDPTRRLVVAISSVWPTPLSRESGAARAALVVAIKAAIDSEARAGSLRE